MEEYKKKVRKTYQENYWMNKVIKNINTIKKDTLSEDELLELAKQERNKYYREYYKNNKEKIKEYKKKSLENKALELMRNERGDYQKRFKDDRHKE